MFNLALAIAWATSKWRIASGVLGRKQGTIPLKPGSSPRKMLQKSGGDRTAT
jgi:hypothetical protein